MKTTNMSFKKPVIIFLLSIAFSLLFNTLSIQAQSIDLSQTLSYLNEKFEKKIEFKDKKKYVLVSIYKNGDVYREDKLFLKDLSPEDVEYSKEEEAVIVRCREKGSKCIEKKIPHLKKLDNYSRSTYIVKGKSEISINGIKEAIIHLIKLAYYDDYQRTEPFE